mgnify:CR=1 FL=1
MDSNENLCVTMPKSTIISELFNVSFPVIFDNEYGIGFNTKIGTESLKIFNMLNYMDVLSVPINVNRYKYDYWFRHNIRPNRIYITDFSGFRIYDFNLSLLFERNLTEIEKNEDVVYGFEIDPHNWNYFWIWKLSEDYNYTDKTGNITTYCYIK